MSSATSEWRWQRLGAIRKKNLPRLAVVAWWVDEEIVWLSAAGGHSASPASPVTPPFKRAWQWNLFLRALAYEAMGLLRGFTTKH